MSQREEPTLSLLDSISEAASYDHRLPLLELASSILAVLGPRHATLTAARGSAGPDRAGFLQALLGSPLPETLVLLAVIHALSTDELERARIARVLRSESAEAEELLTEFADLRPYRAVEMVHVLDDGDNILVGVRGPDGDEFTLVIYIDHNMGTLVKDAQALPGPIEDVLETMRYQVEDPDTRWTDIPLADARVRIQDAAERTSAVFPRLDAEQWPALRPLTEAVLRLAPGGGKGYQRQAWSRTQLEELADAFFASPFANPLGTDGSNHAASSRALLWAILHFGRESALADPMRWSPVAAEIILVDWAPRTLLGLAVELEHLPAVLRAFVRYCHDRRGIRGELTRETLASIDEFEPEFRRLISNQDPGPMSAEAVAGFHEIMLEIITRTVGGVQELNALDDTPLPDEDFDWTGIPKDIHQRVAEVLMLCDRGTTALLDTEHRTAARRFLARAAAGDPAAFRRRGSADMSAAAVCWIIAKANNSFSTNRLYVKDLMAHFGVGGASQRAKVFLSAVGVPADNPEMELGSADLLVSVARSELIRMRDGARAVLDQYS